MKVKIDKTSTHHNRVTQNLNVMDFWLLQLTRLGFRLYNMFGNLLLVYRKIEPIILTDNEEMVNVEIGVRSV